MFDIGLGPRINNIVKGSVVVFSFYIQYAVLRRRKEQSISDTTLEFSFFLYSELNHIKCY